MNATNTQPTLAQALPRSIVILGRLWRDKINGNTYHSAQVLADGVLVACAPFQYGYGSQWEWSAAIALEKAGLMPDRKRYGNSSVEPLWTWCERHGIAFASDKAYCTNRECKVFGALLPAPLGVPSTPTATATTDATSTL